MPSSASLLFFVLASTQIGWAQGPSRKAPPPPDPTAHIVSQLAGRTIEMGSQPSERIIFFPQYRKQASASADWPEVLKVVDRRTESHDSDDGETQERVIETGAYAQKKSIVRVGLRHVGAMTTLGYGILDLEKDLFQVAYRSDGEPVVIWENSLAAFVEEADGGGEELPEWQRKADSPQPSRESVVLSGFAMSQFRMPRFDDSRSTDRVLTKAETWLAPRKFANPVRVTVDGERKKRKVTANFYKGEHGLKVMLEANGFTTEIFNVEVVEEEPILVVKDRGDSDFRLEINPEKGEAIVLFDKWALRSSPLKLEGDKPGFEFGNDQSSLSVPKVIAALQGEGIEVVGKSGMGLSFRVSDALEPIDYEGQRTNPFQNSPATYGYFEHGMIVVIAAEMQMQTGQEGNEQEWLPALIIVNLAENTVAGTAFVGGKWNYPFTVNAARLLLDREIETISGGTRVHMKPNFEFERKLSRRSFKKTIKGEVLKVSFSLNTEGGEKLLIASLEFGEVSASGVAHVNRSLTHAQVTWVDPEAQETDIHLYFDLTTGAVSFSSPTLEVSDVSLSSTGWTECAQKLSGSEVVK